MQNSTHNPAAFTATLLSEMAVKIKAMEQTLSDVKVAVAFTHSYLEAKAHLIKLQEQAKLAECFCSVLFRML